MRFLSAPLLAILAFACSPAASGPTKPPAPDLSEVNVPEGTLRPGAENIHSYKSVAPFEEHAPNPDFGKVATTRTARIVKKRTVGVYKFCISPAGRTQDIATVQSTKDPELDQILSDTLSNWRFRPIEVDGKAASICAEYKFVLTFPS